MALITPHGLRSLQLSDRSLCDLELLASGGLTAEDNARAILGLLRERGFLRA
jgi:hypothetical protein